MNYIKFYIGDYLKKTGSLSVAEHGAYMLMLMSYYATEEPLPKGKELYRLIRAETRQEREAVDAIVARFWRESADGLTHERADEEIQKAAKAREQHALAGTKGGRPRKQMETKLVSELKANEKPTNTSNHINTPQPPKGGAVSFPPGFEKFWEAYPRKDAKAQAMKAFAKLRADEALLASILRGVAAARDCEQWQRDGGKFVPYAATWLNGRRWEDEAVQVCDPFRGAL